MEENKTSKAYREMLHDRILDVAMKAFAAKGIRAVKMDDIAQQMGISKRTLYEIFENKEVLLFEGVEKHKGIKQQELHDIVSSSGNVMDVILNLYQLRIEEFKRVSPQFYVDIKKYPRVMSLLESDKKVMHQRFLDFLLRGVGEGVFRDDLEYELVAEMFNAMTQFVMSGNLYKEYSLEQIFYNLIFVTLRGFCTTSGIEVLDAFMSKHRPR